MSVTHADFTIERRFGCTPRQAFSAFADPELKRQWFAVPGDWADAAAAREHGTGKALERLLAAEPVR